MTNPIDRADPQQPAIVLGMVHAGRPLLLGATISATILLGTLGVEAGTDTVPYVPAFQDLEISRQSSAEGVHLVGGGFAPNSDAAVTVVDNETGEVVYEAVLVTNAVGQAELKVTFEEALPAGNYTATVVGVASGQEPIQMSGALVIAETFRPPATTARTSENEPSASPADSNTGASASTAGATASENVDAPTTSGAARGDSLKDEASREAPSDDAEAAAFANDTQDGASGEDSSSTKPWIVGGLLAVLSAALLIGTIRLARARS